MPLQFGQKPTSERIFVRIQSLDGEGKITRTQSMNVWQAEFDTVLSAVTQALSAVFGGTDLDPSLVTEAPVPIKGRLRRGRKA